jgi:HK97 family phage major capsid protein
LTADQAYRIAGVPVKTTTQIPDDTVLLVDFSQVAIARDQDVSVRIFDQALAQSDSLAVRVTSRWDLGLLNAAGVVKATGITS